MRIRRHFRRSIGLIDHLLLNVICLVRALKLHVRMDLIVVVFAFLDSCELRFIGGLPEEEVSGML